MMTLLSKDEVKQRHNEILAWTRKQLKANSYLYNILNTIKQHEEQLEEERIREKLTPQQIQKRAYKKLKRIRAIKLL